MSKYIDAGKLKYEIERRNLSNYHTTTEGYEEELYEIIDSLQQEAQEEEKARKKRYNESFMAYWKSVIDTIDNKRALPSFKGQLLHDFKNELHTMKQIVGLINHPEIHEGLFDKLALVFAAWGGYHFHPKESLPEDALQQEQPEVDLEKEVRIYCGSSFRFNYDELNDSFYSNAFEFDDVVELARYFYELGLKVRKEE